MLRLFCGNKTPPAVTRPKKADDYVFLKKNPSLADSIQTARNTIQALQVELKKTFTLEEANVLVEVKMASDEKPITAEEIEVATELEEGSEEKSSEKHISVVNSARYINQLEAHRQQTEALRKKLVFNFADIALIAKEQKKTEFRNQIRAKNMQTIYFPKLYWSIFHAEITELKIVELMVTHYHTALGLSLNQVNNIEKHLDLVLSLYDEPKKKNNKVAPAPETMQIKR